ncbi:hypothetical protein [Actinopolymorpha alba]|uniref:hypothetical protein n=1 Tax=Actinopolymorpha alba TaxID=533267 RepID=UPI00037FD20D|nr:hypothetical protein [Actinopolymorpha alba]
MTRLLSLDYDPVYGENAVRSHFSSSRSVFDFDVVIWDPEASFHDYRLGATSYQGLQCLSDNESVRFKSDIARRREEFIEFLHSGKALIVIARPPLECYVATGEVTHSGTGRSHQTNRLVSRWDLLKAVPTPAETVYRGAHGDRIEVLGDGALPALLRKYGEYLTYDAVLTNSPGTVIARVASAANRVVAFQQVTKGGGLFTLIPVPHFPRSEHDEDEEPLDDDYSPFEDVVASAFQEELLEAVSRTTGVRDDERPAWADSYTTRPQREARERVVQQQQVLAAARADLSRAEAEVVALDAHDQLYLGTGRALELEVKEVLELLGGEVTDPEPGRDDWRVTFPEGEAVVEVKGVTKSAAEKHAAQLEKWVASAITEDKPAPKGILVVNTWRATPLSDRTGEDFPAQMIPYSKSRGHCLVLQP